MRSLATAGSTMAWSGSAGGSAISRTSAPSVRLWTASVSPSLRSRACSVELADGRTLFPVPNEFGLIPTEHALLLRQGETLAVHNLTDGALVGEIAVPPAEPDQVTVLPAVASDLTVYLGRGCAGRG